MEINILKIDNLSYSVENKEIIKNISLEIPQNKITLLFGQNGCGKTTIMRLINGLVNVSSGNISYMEQSILHEKRKSLAKKICYISANHNITFNYKVIDFVLLGRMIHSTLLLTPKEEDIVFSHNILKSLDIAHLKDRNMLSLSSGEKQLVVFARALSQNSNILMLDEPTSNLDYNNQFEIMDRIKELSTKHNKTIILAHHDPNIAYSYCDKIIFINNGEILNSISKTNDNFNTIFENSLNTIYSHKSKIMEINNKFHVIKD